MIPEEAIEAAAKAAHISKYSRERWSDIPEWIKSQRLRETKAALEAAAPFIRAQALEDAARELARLPYVKPDAEGRYEYERMLDIRRGNTDGWLLARAVTERGGE